MSEEEIDPARERLKVIAKEYLERGDAVGWFERLYSEVDGDAEQLPWGDMKPNRFLYQWIEEFGLRADGRNALVIGCGLGDDAFFLEDLGFDVTAFDISKTAIDWAKKLKPKSNVNFQVADLFNAPKEWEKAFDLVLEVYTVQALPLELREESIKAITDFVGDEGELIVVERHRENNEELEGLPWSLSPFDLTHFEKRGLKEVGRNDYFGDEEEPIKRFVAIYRR